MSTATTYYRSRVLTPTRTQPALLANADVILALLSHIQLTDTLPEPAVLHDQLCHELHALTTQLQATNVDKATIQVTHYILCASLDDVLNHATWPAEQHWTRYQLLPQFCDETNSDHYQRFFVILERLLTHPKRHRDLLELMYYCLLFGFQGPYRQRGHHYLEQTLEHIYTHIAPQDDIQHTRFSPYTLTNNAIEKKNRSTKSLSGKFTLLLAGVLLVTLYTGFEYMQRLREKPLQTTIQTLIHQNQI